MTKRFLLPLCTLSVLLLASCATASHFAVASAYDEKKDVDVTSAQFRISVLPIDVLQIFRNVAKKDGKISYGIYNTFTNSLSPHRPYVSVVAFVVDSARTDFYGKSIGHEDLYKADEAGYYYANKPALGNSTVASEAELITDADPAATDAAIVKLLTSIQKANTLMIKLFGDRTDSPDTYTYTITPENLAALKDFCNSTSTR